MDWPSQPLRYSKRIFALINRNRLLTLVLVMAVFVASVVIRDLYSVFVRGDDWKHGTGFAGRTLWDWMELLIIPAVLAVGAYLFNRSERANDRKIAADRQREAALQFYLDKMANLLLEKDLKGTRELDDSPVRDMAQVHTITTLRLLDEERRNILFQFLRDSGLADFVLVGASLTNIDLSNTDMELINLSNANLSDANLSNAFLAGATLDGAIMLGTNLQGAFLLYTRLIGAILDGADLRSAEVHDYIEAQAESLKGAIMPDCTTHK